MCEQIPSSGILSSSHRCKCQPSHFPPYVDIWGFIRSCDLIIRSQGGWVYTSGISSCQQTWYNNHNSNFFPWSLQMQCGGPMCNTECFTNESFTIWVFLVYWLCHLIVWDVSYTISAYWFPDGISGNQAVKKVKFCRICRGWQTCISSRLLETFQAFGNIEFKTEAPTHPSWLCSREVMRFLTNWYLSSASLDADYDVL